jgi:hypothetical protein
MLFYEGFLPTCRVNSVGGRVGGVGESEGPEGDVGGDLLCAEHEDDAGGEGADEYEVHAPNGEHICHHLNQPQQRMLAIDDAQFPMLQILYLFCIFI